MGQFTTQQQVEEADGSFEISSPHLQYLVDAVGRFTKEARLRIEDGLVKILEVDAAHVAIVKAGAPVSAHEGEDAELFLPVNYVKKALDPVPLGEVDPIKVSWEGKWVTLSLPGGHDFSYKQAPTSGMTDPKIPDLNLPVKLKVKARDVWDAVRRCNNIGADHCEFLFEDKFTIKGEQTGGKDGVGARRHVTEIDVEDYIRTSEHARSLFSLDYLRSFTCATAWQGNATLVLGNDYPIKAYLEPGDASVMMMSAPRIEGA